MKFWSNGKQWDINNTKRCAMALWRDLIFFTQRHEETRDFDSSYYFTQRCKGATKDSIDPSYYFTQRRKGATKDSIDSSYRFTQRRKGAKAQREMQLLHHSSTPSLHHSNTPSLQNSTPPLLQTLLLAILFLTITSCQTKADKLKVSRVDSISFRMEETAKVYFEIDTTKIDSFYNIILFNLKRLSQMEKYGDKNLVMNYGTLKKGFKVFIKRRPYTLEELEFCRRQIHDLRQDVENGLLSDEDFELYLKHEANASQSMRVQMSYYQSRITAQLSTFERLNPQIDSLINSLKP